MVGVGALVFYLQDNEPVANITVDDAAMYFPPPGVVKKTSGPPGDVKKPSGSPPTTSPPPSGPLPDKPIDLSQYKLNISDYEVIKLKSDRSFIRAFYYIRNKEDPTDEKLQTFVDTNLIAPIKSLDEADPERVNFVMHFSHNFGKDPYISFSTIRDALTKALVPDAGVFTIKDLLDVAKVSSSMRYFLQTNEANITTFLKVVKKILPEDGSFYKKPSSEETNFIILDKKSTNDKTSLPLFQSLWVKMKDRPSLIQSIEKSLKDASTSLVANSKNKKGEGYQLSNREYNTFIKNLRNSQTSEINFSKRCGIGDILALSTKPELCVTFLKANKDPYNYGCENRNKIYKDKYIIYKYENNHCVLLKPKALTESKTLPQPPPTPVVSILKKKDKQKGKTPVAEVKASVAEVKASVVEVAEVKPVKVKPVEVNNNCDEYEKDLFLIGGTRKHRKRKHKVVTKRRRGSNRKSRRSRRKGTRRI
jgi:hypothetical protein